MPWMDVKIDVAADANCPAHTVDNVVNIDQIIRVGKLPNGACYIRLEDGQAITVIDKYDEVVSILLAADKKNGDS
jgi:hypothetical protein